MEIKYKLKKLPEYKTWSKEVVRVLDGLPHLLVRIEVSGEYFPHRAPHPFVMIRTGREKYFRDLLTEVSPDNQKLVGYLPVNLPMRGSIVFGYGDEIWGTVPLEFNADSVTRLDRKKLPKEIVIVNDDFLLKRK
jgi:hypothetical protein